MVKKPRKSGQPEMLPRNVEISSFSATVRLDVVHHKGQEPYIESEPWLELRGIATDPVRDVRDVTISVYPRDTPQIGAARPPSVGALIQTRPALDFVLPWPQADFDRVWALAVSGRLTHGRLYFTKPHYGRGRVVNASFSTEAEE